MTSVSIEESVRTKSGWVNRRRLSQLGVHAALIVFMLIVFIPIIWTIATSFKDRPEFMTNSASLIPHSFSLVNYQYVLSQVRGLPQYLLNSLILASSKGALRRPAPLPAVPPMSSTKHAKPAPQAQLSAGRHLRPGAPAAPTRHPSSGSP